MLSIMATLFLPPFSFLSVLLLLPNVVMLSAICYVFFTALRVIAFFLFVKKNILFSREFVPSTLGWHLAQSALYCMRIIHQ